MRPLRTGFFYGAVASVITVLASFRFLYLQPDQTGEWMLAAAETFLPVIAVAAQIFLGILAALRVWPSRVDPEVPYRSILLRDCTLAASLVGVTVGVALMISVALQASIFADDMREYANEAAPHIVSYLEEAREGLSDPPPAMSAGQVERGLQPPPFRDLGLSLANLVIRAILLGVLGAVVGILRGRFGSR